MNKEQSLEYIHSNSRRKTAKRSVPSVISRLTLSAGGRRRPWMLPPHQLLPGNSPEEEEGDGRWRRPARSPDNMQGHASLHNQTQHCKRLWTAEEERATNSWRPRLERSRKRHGAVLERGEHQGSVVKPRRYSWEGRQVEQDLWR